MSRLGASFTLDLPWRWRLEGGASTLGADLQLRQRPAAKVRDTAEVAPTAPPLPAPAPKPAPIEGGTTLDAERASFGFERPRWSPFADGEQPDP